MARQLPPGRRLPVGRGPGRAEGPALGADEGSDFRLQLAGDFLAVEGKGDVGREEADLRSAVERPSAETAAVERLGLGETDHGVSQLDLVAGAAALLGK